MTKREEEARASRLSNTVTISSSTPVDGTVDQKPLFDRQTKPKRKVKAHQDRKTTHVVIPESIEIAARAILRDYRKRFALRGPDSDYLERHDDGTITVHHNDRWRKKRAAVKRPPVIAD